MAGLYCNATLSFTGLTDNTQVKGFAVYRRGDPKYSAADVSNHITHQMNKNRVDILVVQTLDPRVLKLVPGASGTLSLVAKTADGGSDLTFSGTAMVHEVAGGVTFADVETIQTVTFSVISSDGAAASLSVA